MCDKIGTDERVAAFDVVAEVGQGAFVEQFELSYQRLLGLAFQHLQQERQFGDLYGLRVNVHAVNIIQQDALAFGGG